MFFYHRLTNDSLKLTPKIRNTGRVSASNVRVEIIFPDFIVPLEVYDAGRISEPENIFPANPIVIKRTLSGIRGFLGGGMSSLLDSARYDRVNKSIISAALELPSSSLNSWVDIKDSVVEVFRSKVMHTKSAECDSFIIVPIKRGDGIVRINVICEEYKEQTTFEVPISVK